MVEHRFPLSSSPLTWSINPVSDISARKPKAQVTNAKAKGKGKSDGTTTSSSRRPRCMYRLPSRLLDCGDESDADSDTSCSCSELSTGCASADCTRNLQSKPPQPHRTSSEPVSLPQIAQIAETGEQTAAAGALTPPREPRQARQARRNRRRLSVPSPPPPQLPSLPRSAHSSSSLVMFNSPANGALPYQTHSRHTSSSRAPSAGDRRSFSNGTAPQIAVNGSGMNGAVPVPTSQQNGNANGFGPAAMPPFDGPRSPPSNKSK
jgi:hypothetical protein